MKIGSQAHKELFCSSPARMFYPTFWTRRATTVVDSQNKSSPYRAVSSPNPGLSRVPSCHILE